MPKTTSSFDWSDHEGDLQYVTLFDHLSEKGYSHHLIDFVVENNGYHHIYYYQVFGLIKDTVSKAVISSDPFRLIEELPIYLRRKAATALVKWISAGEYKAVRSNTFAAEDFYDELDDTDAASVLASRGLICTTQF